MQFYESKLLAIRNSIKKIKEGPAQSIAPSGAQTLRQR